MKEIFKISREDEEDVSGFVASTFRNIASLRRRQGKLDEKESANILKNFAHDDFTKKCGNTDGNLSSNFQVIN